jgi:hypothetical protein
MDERITAGNSSFGIGGVSPERLCMLFSTDSFMLTESSVLSINACAEKPDHPKSPNRYATFKITRN